MFILTLLSLTRLAEAAPPPDISFIKSTVYSKKQTSSSSAKALLVAYNLQLVEDIARDRGYPDWFGKDNSIIKRELDNLLDRSLGSNPSSEKLYQSTVKTFSGYYAEEAMARAVKAPSVVQRKGGGVGLLTASAQVSNSGSMLKIIMSKSYIEEDVGFIGSGNGLLEEGESAVVAIYLENTSSKRLYSSSLYLTSVGSCLFSPNKKNTEIQLPEMNPGEGFYYKIPVYASSECAGGSNTIRFKVHDSAYFSSSPYNYSVSLKPKSAGSSVRIRLDGLRLDGDDYGHSETAELKPIQANNQFEFRTGVSLRIPKVEYVTQNVYVPSFLESQYTVLNQPVSYSNGVGRARPQDDVDIKAPSKDKLQSSLLPIASHFGWETPEDAKIFVAVDTVANQVVSSSFIPPTTETTPKVDSLAYDKLLQKYLKVDVITSKGSQDLLTELDGYLVRPNDSDSRIELLEALQKTIGDGEVTTTSAGQTNKQYRDYTFRNYIELPIDWEPEQMAAPVCQLSVVSKNVLVGKPIQVRGRVTNYPTSAVINLRSSDGFQKTYDGIDLNVSTFDAPRAEFSQSISTSKSGSVRLTMAVQDGDDILCVSTASVNVKSKAKKPVEKDKRMPKLASVELGWDNDVPLGFGGPGAMLSIGRGVRAQVGIKYTGFEYVPSAGIRFTQVLNQKTDNDKFYMELSEIGSISLFDNGIMTTTSVMFSAHKVFGVFSKVDAINRFYGTYGRQEIDIIATAGVGIYF